MFPLAEEIVVEEELEESDANDSENESLADEEDEVKEAPTVTSSHLKIKFFDEKNVDFIQHHEKMNEINISKKRKASEAPKLEVTKRNKKQKR